jgi:hypothetical protein
VSGRQLDFVYRQKREALENLKRNRQSSADDAAINRARGEADDAYARLCMSHREARQLEPSKLH